MRKTLAKIGSLAALALTVVPALLVFGGHFTLEQNRLWMTLGAVLWFLVTPVWMKPST